MTEPCSWLREPCWAGMASSSPTSQWARVMSSARYIPPLRNPVYPPCYSGASRGSRPHGGVTKDEFYPARERQLSPRPAPPGSQIDWDPISYVGPQGTLSAAECPFAAIEAGISCTQGQKPSRSTRVAHMDLGARAAALEPWLMGRTSLSKIRILRLENRVIAPSARANLRTGNDVHGPG